MRDCRAKRSEIWDSWELLVYIWCTFDLVALKVILRSFVAFVIFRYWDLLMALYDPFGVDVPLNLDIGPIDKKLGHIFYHKPSIGNLNIWRVQ